jgi:hypothetical protein
LSFAARVVSIFRSITIVIAIAVVFLFGVATTVYLSLRSPEVKVPDVVGKDRFEAEKILEEADLKYRVRASRPSNQAKSDTVLFQLPRAGEVVKTGQTVAMDISRPAKAGESPETVTPADQPSENRNTNASANANENKPRKPKPKNANDNLNDNANANTNTNTNRATNSNRPANVNRPNANTTVDNVNAVPRSNANQRSTSNVNQRNTNSRPANSNANDNRRPVLRPTPAVPKPDR